MPLAYCSVDFDGGWETLCSNWKKSSSPVCGPAWSSATTSLGKFTLQMAYRPTGLYWLWSAHYLDKASVRRQRLLMSLMRFQAHAKYVPENDLAIAGSLSRSPLRCQDAAGGKRTWMPMLMVSSRTNRSWEDQTDSPCHCSGHRASNHDKVLCAWLARVSVESQRRWMNSLVLDLNCYCPKGCWSMALALCLVSSRLDYCNSLLSGIMETDLTKLQRVLNRLARVVTKSPPFTRSVPLLRSLHWLPVKYRVHFKICLLTYKAFHEEQPVYLRSLIAISLPSRSLRSNRGITLSISRIKTNTGARAFGSCAPSLWNNFPLSVRSATSVATFRSCLQTYLFDLAFLP